MKTFTFSSLALAFAVGASALFVSGAANAEEFSVRIPIAPANHSPLTQSIDLGNVLVNTQVTRTLSLVNRGSTAFDIKALSVSGRPAMVTNNSCSTGATLAPNESCSFTVSLTPLQVGLWQSAVSITHTGANTADVYVLNANGVSLASPLRANPGTLSFGQVSVQTLSEAQSVSVKNEGSEPVALVALKLQDNLLHYQLIEHDCERTLGPQESCTAQLAFYPRLLGTISSRLVAELEDGSKLHVSSLTGEGVQGVPSFSVNSVSFNNVAQGLPSPVQTLTLNNVGKGALGISSLQLLGDEAFEVTSTSCGEVLPAGQSCTIGLRVTPPDMSIRNAVLELLATGTNTRVSRVQLFMQPTVAAAALEFQPAALSFDSVAVGSASTKSVALRSVGNVAASVSGYSFADARFKAVNASQCVGSLEPGMQCILQIEFRPTGKEEVRSTATTQAQLSTSPPVLGLSGSGLVAAVGVQNRSVTFDATTVGATSTKALTVSNEGQAPMSLTGLTFQGVPAGVMQASGCLGTLLQPGQSCTVTLRFAPAAAYTYVGTLKMVASGGSNPVDVAVTGVGLPLPTPGASLVPGADCAQGVQYGQPSTCTVTVNSTGSADLVLTGYTLQRTAGDYADTRPAQTSANASAFFGLSAGAAYSSATGRLTLPPGTSAKFKATVMPQAAGLSPSTAPSALAYATANAGAGHVNTLSVTRLNGEPLTLAMAHRVLSADVEVTPDPLGMSVQSASTGTAKLTLQNKGLAAVQFATSPTALAVAPGVLTQVSGPTGWLRVASTSCNPSQPLLPGQSCEVVLACAATTAGLTSSGKMTLNLAVPFTRANDTVYSLAKRDVAVSCTAVPPSADLVPAYPLLTTRVATSSQSGNWLKFVNKGTAPLTFDSVLPMAGLTAYTDAADSTHCVKGRVLQPGDACVFLEVASKANLGATPVELKGSSVIRTAQATFNYGSSYQVEALHVAPTVASIDPLARGSSKDVTLRVTNQTPSDITEMVFVPPAGITVVSHTCAAGLRTGESCTVETRLAPTSAFAENWAFVLRVDGKFARLINAAKAPSAGLVQAGQWSTTLQTYQPLGLLTASAHRGAFDTPSTATHVLRNTGKGPLTVQSISVQAVGNLKVSANRCPSALAAGAECSFDTTFSASELVNTTATLTAQTNAGPVTAKATIQVMPPGQISTRRFFSVDWIDAVSADGAGATGKSYVSPYFTVMVANNMTVAGWRYGHSQSYSYLYNPGVYLGRTLMAWSRPNGTGSQVLSTALAEVTPYAALPAAKATVSLAHAVTHLVRRPGTDTFYAIGNNGVSRMTISATGAISQVVNLGAPTVAGGAAAPSGWSRHHAWGADGNVYFLDNVNGLGLVRFDPEARQGTWLATTVPVDSDKTGVASDGYGNMYMAGSGGIYQLPWNGTSFGAARRYFPANSPSGCVSAHSDCYRDGNAFNSSMWYSFTLGPGETPDTVSIYEQGTGGASSMYRRLTVQ